FIFKSRLRLLYFTIFDLDLGFLLRKQLGLFLQFRVRFLQLLRQGLALFEQFFRPHSSCNRVEHNANALRQLVEKSKMHLIVLPERRKLNNSLRLALKQHWKDDDADWSALSEAGSNPDRVSRNVGYKNSCSFGSALTD